MNLTLFDAFGRYGAKPRNRQSSLSAMAHDGAMVLNCLPAHFCHPAQGVLRYDAKLSLVQANAEELGRLGRHLTDAHDNHLPVRLIVRSPPLETGRTKRPGYHVRPDLLGAVVEFDGDHFVVDFTRPAPNSPAARSERRKQRQ